MVCRWLFLDGIDALDQGVNLVLALSEHFLILLLERILGGSLFFA